MNDTPGIPIGTPRVDIAAAQRSLDSGQDVRTVATSQGVRPQSIYDLLRRGTLRRHTCVCAGCGVQMTQRRRRRTVTADVGA